MKNYQLQIPEGVRDYKNYEMEIKEDIQNKFITVFKKNNYQLIETPSFEYLDVFQEDKNVFQQPSLYHLINRDGEITVLKSDETRAIARVIATEKDHNFPKRLCYLTNTFRYPEKFQDKLHEFTQVGIELIGNNSLNSDIEVILLAINALKSININDFTIHISNAEFLNSIMDELGLDDENKNKIYMKIKLLDAVGLKKELESLNVKKEILQIILELIESVGKIDLLENIRQKTTCQKAIDALNKLEETYQALASLGLEKYILFDFSILSFGTYYTGINFQAYVKGIGYRIIEGGRYDKLISEFGFDIPAIGFGIYINQIVKKLLNEGYHIKPKKKYLIGYSLNKINEAIIQAEKLQETGVVEFSLSNDYNETKNYAIKNRFNEMLFIGERFIWEVIK